MDPDGIRVHRHARPGVGAVNSYLIETARGIVLIDAQRTLSEGRDVAARISALGKPLSGILLTHPHPDHVGGLVCVLDAFPDAPGYASPATAEEMRTDASGYLAATRAALPNDAPETLPQPTRLFAHGDRLDLDGLEVLVDEIGLGEAKTMTMSTCRQPTPCSRAT